MMLTLDTPLGSLRGIGPRRALSLKKLGYETVEDLLRHVPLRYEDRSRFVSLGEIAEGQRASFSATVRSPRLIRTRRRGFTIFEALLDDGSAAVPAVWFNQPYLARLLVEGRSGFFYGELRWARSGRRALRFENPQFESVDPGDADPIHTGRIVPVYERLGRLTGKMIRSLIFRILQSGGAAADTDSLSGNAKEGLQAAEFLPLPTLARHGLPGRGEAIRGVHFPPSQPSADALEDRAAGTREPPELRGTSGNHETAQEAGGHAGARASGTLDALNRRATPWHRRLIFDEFFLLQLGLALRRSAARREVRAFAYATTPAIREKLRAILPFRLTDGQRKVLREIVSDMKSPHPMNRLLQGDVGSGKTIVAVLAMALAAENEVQSALMAPTEILAEQHARSLRERLEPAGYRITLLTSAVRGKERREHLEALEAGEVPIAVGTHALLQKGVAFHRLGLVVVDEQHRFGVEQRALLREKGLCPDTLVMTATPIPRTLALSVYGDLDLSIIDGMPPGRSKVTTLIREEADRPGLYEWMRREIERGRKAFIVYPVLEESHDSGLRAAKVMAKTLADGVFRGRRVGLVHGRMKAGEKMAAMAAFREGEVAILVATTVVEVGIDVPDATILVVEHAERFGLSQLHQLRGRIGRGGEESTCVLIAGENQTDAARARLGAIERESSGFRLAEIDLEIRGPGELLGTRQSGLPDLRIGDLARDLDLLEAARREAFELAGSGEGDDGHELRSVLERLAPTWRERFRLARLG